MNNKIIYTGDASVMKWGYKGNVTLKENEKSWDCKLQDPKTMIDRAEYFAETVFKEKIQPTFLDKGGLIPKASLFAELCHLGQFRKYGNPPIPYFVHPQRIVNKLDQFLNQDKFDGFKDYSSLICAAYLHDTAEDCGVPISLIEKYFGKETASFVDDLTDKFKDATDSKGKLLIRKERSRLEHERLKTIQNPSKWIKMLDRLDNLSDMSYNNCGSFMNVYLQESSSLLQAVGDGDTELCLKLSERIMELISKVV